MLVLIIHTNILLLKNTANCLPSMTHRVRHNASNVAFAVVFVMLSMFGNS